ncbi:hypothetical protein B0H16DRAFT_750720 [Mycena metata]|uniref:Uncharacterized protein n=1 Tax=Mycena metata TaxID=1033252 RepID=A0AAD7DYL9_9AGAR|nr:hypothetical protein B0H16DRAFT_750720 [Mycena metata]
MPRPIRPDPRREFNGIWEFKLGLVINCDHKNSHINTTAKAKPSSIPKIRPCLVVGIDMNANEVHLAPLTTVKESQHPGWQRVDVEPRITVDGSTRIWIGGPAHTSVILRNVEEMYWLPGLPCNEEGWMRVNYQNYMQRRAAYIQAEGTNDEEIARRHEVNKGKKQAGSTNMSEVSRLSQFVRMNPVSQAYGQRKWHAARCCQWATVPQRSAMESTPGSQFTPNRGQSAYPAHGMLNAQAPPFIPPANTNNVNAHLHWQMPPMQQGYQHQAAQWGPQVSVQPPPQWGPHVQPPLQWGPQVQSPPPWPGQAPQLHQGHQYPAHQQMPPHGMQPAPHPIHLQAPPMPQQMAMQPQPQWSAPFQRPDGNWYSSNTNGDVRRL